MKKYLTIILIFMIGAGIFSGCGRPTGPPGIPGRYGSGKPPMNEKTRARIEALLNQAKQLIRENKLEQAANLFKQILEIDKDSVQAYEGLTLVYAKLKNWNVVLKYADLLLALDPENVNGLLYRAMAYKQKGNMEKFLADRRRANQASPLTVHTNVELARALSETGNFDESLEVLSRAEALNPTPREKSDILIARTYSLIHKDKYKEAEKSAQEVIKRGVFKAHGHFLLMEIYLDTDRKEKAWQEYKVYKKLDPGEKLVKEIGPGMQAVMYHALGTIHRERGEYEKAEKLYEMARSLKKTEPDYNLSRVTLLAEMGKKTEAVNEAKLWMNANPPNPKTPEQMADYAVAYALLGQKQQAMATIDNAIRNAPDNALLLATRAMVNHYLGNPEATKKDIARFHKRATPDEIKMVSGFEAKLIPKK